ncbi:BON domain-containing protein [Burkholderia sp. Bp9012]|nr:BON domain-containing protein [Burkholderia sp. Bp9012]
MIDRNRILKGLLVAAIFAVAGTASAQSVNDATGAAGASSAAGTTSPNLSKSTDRKLTRRVATALGRTRGLNATRIIVKTRDGRVTLSGSVPDNGQIPLAVNAAQGVEGVKSVQSALRISEQPL